MLSSNILRMRTKRQCRKLHKHNKIITQVKIIRLTIGGKIIAENMYYLNQRDDVLAWKFEFLMHMNLSIFFGLKNSILHFLNFLSSFL